MMIYFAAVEQVVLKEQQSPFRGTTLLRDGGMAEWTIATVLKTVVGASLPRVRIPLPPYRII